MGVRDLELFLTVSFFSVKGVFYFALLEPNEREAAMVQSALGGDGVKIVVKNSAVIIKGI